MTESNTHLDPDHIQDLEKKYMEKIWEITSGTEFLDNVKFIEKYAQY